MSKNYVVIYKSSKPIAANDLQIRLKESAGINVYQMVQNRDTFFPTVISGLHLQNHFALHGQISDMCYKERLTTICKIFKVNISTARLQTFNFYTDVKGQYSNNTL